MSIFANQVSSFETLHSYVCPPTHHFYIFICLFVYREMTSTSSISNKVKSEDYHKGLVFIMFSPSYFLFALLRTCNEYSSFCLNHPERSLFPRNLQLSHDAPHLNQTKHPLYFHCASKIAIFFFKTILTASSKLLKH